MELGLTLPFLPYGERWRRQRRLMQRYFDPQAVNTFRSQQESEVKRLLKRLLANPQDFQRSVKRYELYVLHRVHFVFDADVLFRLASGVIMKVAYGHTVSAELDPLLEKFERAGNMIAEAGESGGNIFDFFPPCQSILFTAYLQD